MASSPLEQLPYRCADCRSGDVPCDSRRTINRLPGRWRHAEPESPERALAISLKFSYDECVLLLDHAAGVYRIERAERRFTHPFRSLHDSGSGVPEGGGLPTSSIPSRTLSRSPRYLIGSVFIMS